MDVHRCREVAIRGIDRILSFRLFGPSAEERAVLLAARQLVINDDSVVARIAANVGPYHADDGGEGPPAAGG